MDFKGKNIAIIGLGVEALSSASYLLKKGAVITVCDKNEEHALDHELYEKVKDMGVAFALGDEYLSNLTRFDIIVRSPGVKRLMPEILEAEKHGVTVTSHIKIFFEACSSPIIGVTGTKGKGTTSSLIFEMLKKDGRDVYLGGNIGTPPLDFVESLTKDSWVVLELSSFQLQDLHKSPHIAVMLMVTSEHLDYHKDVHEYVDAKRNILSHQTPQDFAIVNKDYPASNESDIYSEGTVYKVSREQDVDKGCFVVDDEIFLKLDEKVEKIAEIKDILLPGRHNLENVCAAIVASICAGIDKKSIQKVLKEFKGLEHRLELVDTIGGVRYYDDSFSTTPETAIAAIEAFEEPEVLILGGSSKGSDFTELGEVLSESPNIKAIIGIGKEWERIRQTIHNKNMMIVEGRTSMHEIVQTASEIAELGDVVILSPACASFDMFKNYKDRGEQFKKEVHNLSLL